ncbi:MAG: cell division protein FtsZ [Bacteroidales bacterium]|nr:cell division protein FtsZ [Bacteroidales bacterium]
MSFENIEIVPDTWIPEESIIKVIGVGGGGCNAVNYMYRQKIEGCTFIVCNTDRQALDKCDVPVKIQLGDDGLGAGTNPTEGRNAALNSQEEIEKILDDNTRMLFITAGMGGGTGTGAAPVIASMARKKGILTVGVVTIPFRNQGNETMSKAIDGITELENNVDSLLIIDNEKLFDVYGDLLVQEAFPKADEVLATAVRGITEIIKKRGHINVDFKDVSTMMKNDNRSGSRYALMGCGTGTGKNRIEDAVKSALESPLLNDFDLNTAQKVLINVTTGDNKEGLTMSQYGEISAMIKKYTGNADNFKSGLVFDDSEDFGDRVNITVIVTGINMTMALPQTEIGNIIMIDSDFRYDKHRTISEQGIELPQVKVHKIGYNSAQVRKKIVFDDNTRPALLVTETQNRGELENISALRRKALPGQNREEL